MKFGHNSIILSSKIAILIVQVFFFSFPIDSSVLGMVHDCDTYICTHLVLITEKSEEEEREGERKKMMKIVVPHSKNCSRLLSRWASFTLNKSPHQKLLSRAHTLNPIHVHVRCCCVLCFRKLNSAMCMRMKYKLGIESKYCLFWTFLKFKPISSSPFWSFIFPLFFFTFHSCHSLFVSFFFHAVDAWSNTRSTMYSYASGSFKYCGLFGRWIACFCDSTSTAIDVPGIHFSEQLRCTSSCSIHPRRFTWYNSTLDSRLAQQFRTDITSHWTFRTMCCMLKGNSSIFRGSWYR